MEYNCPSSDRLSGDTAAYVILFIQGMGNLFPWNSLITAAHYFSVRFCGTSVQHTFESYFSVVTMFSQVVGLAFAMKYLEKLPLKYCVLYPITASAVVMITTASFVLLRMDATLMFAVTLVFCAIVGLSSAVSGGGLFGLSGCLPPVYTGALMSGQALGGIAVSLCSLFTIAAGPRSDMCGGNEVSTVLPTSNSINCVYDVDYSTFAFFSITTVVLIICVLTFIALLMLPFTMYHQEKVTRDLLRGMSLDEMHFLLSVDEAPSTQSTPAAATTSLCIQLPTLGDRSGQIYTGEGTPLVHRTSSGGCPSPRSSTRSRYNSFDHFVVLDADSPSLCHSMTDSQPTWLGSLEGVSLLEHDSDNEVGAQTSLEGTASVAPPSAQESPVTYSATLLTQEKSLHMGPMQPLPFPFRLLSSFLDVKSLSIVHKIHAPATAVFLTLMCTLTLFPSSVVRLRSQAFCPAGREGSRLNSDLFVPIMFVLFNLSDFLGRLLAGFNDFGITVTFLRTAAVTRFALIPLLLLCRMSDSSLPLVFSSDLFPVLFMIILGLSNGFLSTLAMVMFPTLVSPRKVASAGNVMILCLNMGLLCGAAFSFLVLFIST